MILFLEDWARYPTAFIDYNTSNQTFLRMASLYKSMGIQNCAFHLVLLQKELVGVDPHDPDLSIEQKVMIETECRYNPWYYFREVVRIPPIAGPNPIAFKANRGNLALLWLYFCHIDVALIQPRQTGKSVSTDTLMDYLLYIALSNSTIAMLTKDDRLRRINIDRLKEIRDYLPGYLVPRNTRDSDNTMELNCSAHKTLYVAGVSQGSERAANNLGRGMAVPTIHVDEGPFINYIEVTLSAALAGTTAARDEAEKNNSHYGNIFTTTAGKRDDRDGRYMYEFIHGGSVWTEAFLDAKNLKHLKELVKVNCSGRKILVNATFSHRQLGKTDEWLYEKMNDAGSSGDSAARDFLNVWTSGTQSSPLSNKLNDVIRSSDMDPAYIEITKDNYITRWYIEEEDIDAFMAQTYCIIGLDTSEAVGRDSIGLVLSDIRDMATVAAMTVNETNLVRFARFLGDFMIRFRQTVLVPERKSTGSMIIDSLLVLLPQHHEDPFCRIYNTIVDNHSERKDDYKAISKPISQRPTWVLDKYRKHFGFNTTGDSRNLLYGTVLQNAAKKSGHLVHDRTLSNQIRGLVVRKGRIDHEASGNDDMVIAWLLANWLLTQSKNLAHYGLEPTKVLSSYDNAERGELTVEERFREGEQEKIRDEIEDIYTRLENATDQWSIMRLERQLRSLTARVVEKENEKMSIDGLLESAKASRERNAKISRNQTSILDRQQIWGGGHVSNQYPTRF